MKWIIVTFRSFAKAPKIFFSPTIFKFLMLSVIKVNSLHTHNGDVQMLSMLHLLTLRSDFHQVLSILVTDFIGRFVVLDEHQDIICKRLKAKQRPFW